MSNPRIPADNVAFAPSCDNQTDGVADSAADPAADSGRNRLSPAPRYRTIDRSLASGQTLDDLISANDPVRKIYAAILEQFDFSSYDATVKAVEGSRGRAATPPELLAAIWLYGFCMGIVSARELERRCKTHDPFKWLCGGVTVNHHMISDFYLVADEWVNEKSVAVIRTMFAEGLIDEDEFVGQDGMRTRASAGSSSFRSPERIEQMLAEARRLAEKWSTNQEADTKCDTEQDSEGTTNEDTTNEDTTNDATNEDDSNLSPAQRAARRRAANERVERLMAAKEASQQVSEAREKRQKGSGENARASTTDPDARRMKMPDGGYRPAYNVQFATTIGSLVILSSCVTNIGSDCAQAAPMFARIQADHNHVPAVALLDGNYSTKENIDPLNEMGVTVYSPVKQAKQQLAQGKDPYAPKKGDTKAMEEWRARMGEPEGQDIYKERCKCELPNAWCRNRGLTQFPVRGLERVERFTKWMVLAYNLQRLIKLREEKEQALAG